jgi:hypothetical protein
MFLDVVSKLPEEVQLSPHLCGKAAKRRYGKRKYAFFKIQLYGRFFYLPITNEVWEMFNLQDSDFNESMDETPEGKQVKRYTCNRSGLHGFLQLLVDAIALQVRDDVLSGMEQSMMSQIKEQVSQALHPSLRAAIERVADDRLIKALPEAKVEDKL